MSYNHEATVDFIDGIHEVEILLKYAQEYPEDQVLFLKMAIISLVTKFQVFVEGVLREYKYKLKGKPSSILSIYTKLNSVRIAMKESYLNKLDNHRNYDIECKRKIDDALGVFTYLKEETPIGSDFFMEEKFPLGKTGRKELVNLLRQVRGETDPFAGFNTENRQFDTLDSILQKRHLVIHQDRFNGSKNDIEKDILFIKQLSEYIDSYLIIGN